SGDRVPFRAEGMRGYKAIIVVPANGQVSHLRIAQPRGGLDEGVEHWLQVEGRAADDLEHVAGRGLVFERFFEVARARLQFAEQPRVLHRDDRLVGEGAHQLDLPLGERLYPSARQHDDTDWRVFAQQRYTQGRSLLCHLDRLAQAVFRIACAVRDLYQASFERDPAGDRAAGRGDRVDLEEGGKLRREAKRDRQSIRLAIATVDQHHLGFAEPSGRLRNRVQDRLQIEGRAADDLQYVTGRGLIFERLFEVARARLQFAEQPRVLDRDHRLIGK